MGGGERVGEEVWRNVEEEWKKWGEQGVRGASFPLDPYTEGQK